MLCLAVAILKNYCAVDCWEVWDRDNFGTTVGSTNKMARDETKMTAFENCLTTRRNAFGFAQKFVYGKGICWTKRQCVNLVRMFSNMNIFGAVFDAWFRLMLAALVGSRKWDKWLTVLRRKCPAAPFSLADFDPGNEQGQIFSERTGQFIIYRTESTTCH